MSPARWSRTATSAWLYAGPTPNLMTGIAALESDYQQFQRLTLFDVLALWPTEGSDGGAQIGLMQVPNNQARAWDWLANTQDGVDLFVGKLEVARRIEDGLLRRHEGLRELTDVERENMALVLYGPYASNAPSRQYYVPVRNADRQWDWEVNIDGNPDGVAYADSIRQSTKGGGT